MSMGVPALSLAPQFLVAWKELLTSSSTFLNSSNLEALRSRWLLRLHVPGEHSGEDRIRDFLGILVVVPLH